MERFVLYAAVFFLGLLSIGLAGTLYLVAKGNRDVSPSMLVDAVDDAVAVLDDERTVLLANDAFEQLSAPNPEGKPVAEAVGNQPPLKEALHKNREIVTLGNDGAETHLQYKEFVTTTDTGDERTVLLLHDITDHCESQYELEKQNKRLDEFASLIAHDIRNPLDVAIGRTNAAIEAVDDTEVVELLAGVRGSHDRILRIITNVLTLAREGDAIENLEAVSIAKAAENAWSHVETGENTLSIQLESTIWADTARLERLFENLFRNAVEHGGKNTTVTITSLPKRDGFSVADDGPGIAPEERGDIFEAGYSKGGDGTGLGLTIVSRIAQAHGWDIAVTESEQGGAQFDFSGVDSPPETDEPQQTRYP